MCVSVSVSVCSSCGWVGRVSVKGKGFKRPRSRGRWWALGGRIRGGNRFAGGEGVSGIRLVGVRVRYTGGFDLSWEDGVWVRRGMDGWVAEGFDRRREGMGEVVGGGGGGAEGYCGRLGGLEDRIWVEAYMDLLPLPVVEEDVAASLHVVG